MIPEVAGSLSCTLAELEHRLLLRLAEQAGDGDNALLSVLCDAVRLCREYASGRPKPFSYKEGVILGRGEYRAELERRRKVEAKVRELLACAPSGDDYRVMAISLSGQAIPAEMQAHILRYEAALKALEGDE